MAQRKKEDKREAILAAAFSLFTEKGYSETTIPAIAKMAGISRANVYVYFKSKIEILFTLYTPWIEKSLDALRRSLKRTADPRARMEKLLTTFWIGIPQENKGFARNIIEAVSSSYDQEDYDPSLRDYIIQTAADCVNRCTDFSEEKSRQIAIIIVMACDGFATNVSRQHGLECSQPLVELFAGLLCAPERSAGQPVASDRPAAVPDGRSARPAQIEEA